MFMENLKPWYFKIKSGLMKEPFHKKLLAGSSKTAVRIVLIYFFLGVLWNFISEEIGNNYYDRIENEYSLEIIINLVFFLITAFLFYFLIKQAVKNYAVVNHQLESQIELYNIIASNTNDVIWLLNISAGQFKFVSPSVQKLRGFTPEEVMAKPFEESLTKESYELLIKNLLDIINDFENGHESAKTQTAEVNQPCKDGSIVNTEVVITLLKDKSGKVTEVLGVSRDITERKRVKNSIIESEERYRRLVEFSPDAVFVHAEGKVVYSNRAGAKLLRANEPADIYGKRVLDFVQHKFHPVVTQRIGTMEKGSAVPLIEEKFIRLDGTTIDVEVSANPLLFYGKPAIQVIVRDVSERKIAEKELALLNERLSHAAQVAFMGVWDWDLQKNITTWDDKMFEIYGLPKIVPMPNDVWLSTIHPDDIQVVENSLRNTIASGTPDYVEFRIKRSDNGATKYIYAAHGIVKDVNGIVSRLIGSNVDITERKKVEEALKKSEAEMRALFNAMTDVILVLDKTGKYIDVAPNSPNLLFTSREELLGKTLHQIFSKDLADAFLSNITKALEIKNVVKLEYELSIGDSLHWFDGRVTPVTEDTVLFVARDITDRKKTEEALRDSEHWVRESQKVAHLGSYILDFNSGLWESSDILNEIFGIDDNFVKSIEGWFQLIHPDHIEEMKNYFSKVLKEKHPFDKEYRIVRRSDKETRWVHGRGELIIDDHGKLSKMLGIIQDINERKLVEQALVSGEKKYRTIIETALNGFFISDVKGKMIEVNDAFCQMSGYSREELLKKTINDLDFLESSRKINERAIQVIKVGPQKFESKFPAKNGNILTIEVSIAHSPVNDGMFYGFLNNLTEKNKMLMEVLKARDEAERTNQLKSEFLAQISHEIRSPLNVTLSFTNFVREELKNKLTPLLQESFSAIDTSIKRVIRTIDLILNMSEMQLGTYEPTWKNFDLVEDVLNNIQREYEFYAKQKGLDLVVSKKLSQSKVYGDQFSIMQIFANLIDNAIKYTNIGRIEIIIDKDKEKNLAVRVKDTGIGISKEYLSKLFLPFTQEEQGYSRRFEGNGLGLALVKKYCDLNNATISVESEKGIGATFIVTFSRLSKLNVEVN